MPPQNIVEITKAGTRRCGVAGDFVNWAEADWTLHSKARVIGQCQRRESKVKVYQMVNWHDHNFCMHQIVKSWEVVLPR